MKELKLLKPYSMWFKLQNHYILGNQMCIMLTLKKASTKLNLYIYQSIRFYRAVLILISIHEELTLFHTKTTVCLPAYTYI